MMPWIMANEPTLRAGDTGEWVTYLHQMLTYHGHSTSDSETFDPGTESSVQRLQEHHGLPVTGVVDESTWAALLSEPQPEHYKLTFAEPPTIRDGALVWTVRNEGPGKASQYVNKAAFTDLDSGTEVCDVQLTPTEEIEPHATQESFPITADMLGQDMHDGKRYRADVTTHLDGEGDTASVEFTFQHGQLVAD
jgi:peptidoglycan hydrolase-like protein with peptidoglycan-binding domain